MRTRKSQGIVGTDIFFDESRKSTTDPLRLSVDPPSNNRPQTPIAELLYTSTRNLKLRYATGAKIANFLRRGVEMKLGRMLDDEEFNDLVARLMDLDVRPFITSSLILVSELVFHSAQL